MSRLFTDEELEELGKLTIDKLKEAADAGDTERVKELADQMYGEWAFLHDGYNAWVIGLQAYIYDNFGLEHYEKAERYAHGTVEAKVAFDMEMGDMSFEENVRQHCAALKGHVFQPITVTEDDEKVIVKVDPCGSGGRMLQKGAYEKGGARIKEACDITWGLEDFPSYCTHCPMGEQLGVDGGGIMRFTHDVDGFESGREVGPACTYLLYKDPADIPEKCYTRIGRKKPEA